MACFLVPAAEAVITTVIQKSVKSKEKKSKNEEKPSVPFSRKLKWLNNMLWGGAALLAFEHLWHGEITPFFPFLTAASNPEDTAVMLHEMSTVGVTMAVLVTFVWVGMIIVSNVIEKREFNVIETQKAR